MVFAPITKREKGNWHNIIALCERVANGKMNRIFRETFYAALLDYEPPKGHEKDKAKIREIILKYRSDPKEWGIPEIIEYFYPDYLQAKVGAYFTPQPFCQLLTEIAQKYIKPEGRQEGLKVYDPSCGAGALLITFKQYEPDAIIYGQELIYESVLIARQLLTNRRGGDWEQPERDEAGNPYFSTDKVGQIKGGDTLKEDKFLRKFHIILANPPFNQKLSEPAYETKEGNAAGVRHVTKKLKKDGVALIILPGGILATDGFYQERKRLIKYNGLDAVFYNFYHKGANEGQKFNNAMVDTCFLVLRKRARTEQDIYFFDCGKKSIKEIAETGERERESIAKVSREAIKKADYNGLGFILLRFNEEKGQEIEKLFNGTLSRNKEKHPQQGYFIKICHKNGESQGEYLTEIKTEIEGGAISKIDYLYLGSKDGEKETTDKLHYYLLTHKLEHNAFYQGAIIKNLMRPAFLKGKINFSQINFSKEELAALKADKLNAETRPRVLPENNNEKITYNDFQGETKE